MVIHKFAIADAAFERSPGQDGDIFTANLLDQRHGGPVTIGFGRYCIAAIKVRFSVNQDETCAGV